MAAAHDFDDWLCSKLKSLELDEEVFLDYIKGVLEEEITDEEKSETIINILDGALEESKSSSCECEEILKKWKTLSLQKEEVLPVKNGIGNADDKIREIIHMQQATLTANKPTSTTDDDYKRRLLEQYSHVAEDGEGSDDEKKSASKIDSSHSESSLFENMNTKVVMEQQRLHREKQKKSAEEKKEKDKMNREVEKLKKQERQEKEKKRTQKGERKTR